MVPSYKYLTPEQIDFFMTHGYVVIKKALKEEWITRATQDIWIRLGFDPIDKSTWTQERIHQPWHRRVLAKDVAPSAWGAICELVGGEERISDRCKEWRDNMIINLGAKRWETEDIRPQDLDNWHCDGDFFLHFLDSPEQGLLTIPLYSDIKPRGGGTYIAEDSIGVIARWLRDHPEGIMPGMGTGDGRFDFGARLKECKVFTEMTGERGDVILLHPLMLHSASKNHTRSIRFITNPPVSLKEPFNFNRSDSSQFSLVERKTLKELGVEKLDFSLKAPRKNIIPQRLDVQSRILAEELKRMREYAEKYGAEVDSVHKDVPEDKLKESLTPSVVRVGDA
ncbi:unnamed protein product [Rhizoctonia solani]|uniref:Phytanoyl-CoA dioxygenase n=1 Tax=Rhizoctonia solani TaxID=456999 RepID=A0A8H3CX50_9AGAM|nr:unnamed protein product [Rhizoctonia solani]CAE6501064.1 unnamed protein product [Rhizoctonia solani]